MMFKKSILYLLFVWGLAFAGVYSFNWKGEDGIQRKYEIDTGEGFNGTISGLWLDETKLLRGSVILFEENKLWDSDGDDARKNANFQKIEKLLSERAKAVMTESTVGWGERKVKVRHFFYTFEGDDGLYYRIVLEPISEFYLIRAFKVDFFDHLESGRVLQNTVREDTVQGWSEWSLFGAPFSLTQIYLGPPGWYCDKYWKYWTDWGIDTKYKASQNNILYSDKKFLFNNPIRADYIFFPSEGDDPSSPSPKGKMYYERVMNVKEGLFLTKGKNTKELIIRKGHIVINVNDLPAQFDIQYKCNNSKVVLFLARGLPKKPGCIYILREGKQELIYNSNVMDIWKDEAGYNAAFFLKLEDNTTVIISPEEEKAEKKETVKSKEKYVVYCGGYPDTDWEEGKLYGCIRGKPYLGWATLAPGLVNPEKLVREDREKVIYRFTSLEANHNYSVRLSFYNENDVKKFRIMAGSIPIGEIVLPLEQTVTFEKPIPKEAIRNGVLDISVELIEGSSVVVSKIWIIEE
jgi:hypothetical protein